MSNSTSSKDRLEALASSLGAAHPQYQVLLDTVKELGQLETENEALRKHAAAQMSDATLLKELNIHAGSLHIGLEGGAAGLLADSFAQQFLDSGAENYLELQFSSDRLPANEHLVVTLQRVPGLTPSQKVHMANETIADLTEKLIDANRWEPIDATHKDGSWMELWRTPNGRMTPQIIGRWCSENNAFIWPRGPYDVFTPEGLADVEEEIHSGNIYISRDFIFARKLMPPT